MESRSPSIRESRGEKKRQKISALLAEPTIRWTVTEGGIEGYATTLSE